MIRRRRTIMTAYTLKQASGNINFRKEEKLHVWVLSVHFWISFSPYFHINQHYPPPYKASNPSDVIYPTIFASMYWWLLTLTAAAQFSISGLMRSSISRSTRFVSELLLEISTSRWNTVGVNDPPHRSSVQDLVASLHTSYAYFTGLLLALMGIKYQGSSNNPFSEHPTVMMLFLIVISMYGVALTITLRRSNHEHSVTKLMVGVSHICGGLACELLLLVLVSPMQSLLINVSAPTLILTLVSCYKYLPRRPHLFGSAEGTEISQTGGGEVGSSDQVADLEG